MALIQCPDCGTEISDQARACPKCARPIARTDPAFVQKRKDVQTVQQTGKGYKAGMLLEGMFFAFAFLSLCIPAPLIGTPPELRALIAIGGLALYLLFRILAWWQHG